MSTLADRKASLDIIAGNPATGKSTAFLARRGRCSMQAGAWFVWGPSAPRFAVNGMRLLAWDRERVKYSEDPPTLAFAKVIDARTPLAEQVRTAWGTFQGPLNVLTSETESID